MQETISKRKQKTITTLNNRLEKTQNKKPQRKQNKNIEKHQWSKNTQSPNPNGRGKGNANYITRFKQAINALSKYDDEWKGMSPSDLELEMFKTAWKHSLQMSMAGSITRQDIFNRLYGKPVEQIQTLNTTRIIPILGGITKQVTNNTFITPSTTLKTPFKNDLNSKDDTTII